jgi:hypothetical protein
VTWNRVELEEHLFRRESGRLVAALTRTFGVHNLPLAEDVAQDAFCRISPIFLGRGRSLLGGVSGSVKLDLLEARPYPSGNVMLRYAPHH